MQKQIKLAVTSRLLSSALNKKVQSFTFLFMLSLMPILAKAQADDFITTWNLATAGSEASQLSFGVATTGTVNYTWQQVTGGSTTGSGTFTGTTCTITGLPTGEKIKLSIQPTNFQRININNGTDRNRLTNIEQWGTTAWTSMETAFYGCTNLDSITATDAPTLTSVTSMATMFRNCTKFKGIIGNWNTAAVTNMSYMFFLATAFNQPIGNWNTAAVTNMSNMFSSATAFNQPIGNWNTGAVTNMSNMFTSATAFNQAVGNWNTAAVTNMSSMFFLATSFNRSLANWRLTSVFIMSDMLSNCGMNCANYSATLIGWANSAYTPSGRSVGVAGRSYGTNAGAARATLTGSKFWMISGDFSSPTACALSGSTALTSITSSAGSISPAFDSSTLAYYLEVLDTSNVTVTPAAFYSGATLQLSLNSGTYSTITSGNASLVLPLNTGTNTVDIKVTAENGVLVKVYRITITKMSIATDARLSNLTLGSATLLPSFATHLTSYTTSIPYSAETLTFIPTAMQSDATVQVSVNGATYQDISSGLPSTALNMNVGQNTVQIKVTAKNGSTTRTYTINITRLDGTSFITEWNLATAGSGSTQLSFAVATSGSVNYTWYQLTGGSTTGSGSFTGTTCTITGLPAGAIIRLSIAPTNFQRININTGTDRNRLTNISQWGTVAWTSMANAFYGCANMNSTASDMPNLSQVTSLSQMFYNCSKFNAAINDWNTANVTDMGFMFRAASVFNQDISSWNTSNVTNMANMFYSASAFNQPIGNWNTANVTSMNGLFYLATAFNQDIGNWNTANVTNMGNMFCMAPAFNQSIDNWNTGQVTIMNNMFNGAVAFNQPIGSWNTGSVTDMRYMFAGATIFNQPIGNWNISNVSILNDIFSGAVAFNQPIGNWNTANVTTMAAMFNGAKVFDQPIGNWNTVNVTNMSAMFNAALAFNQPIGNWNTVNVTNMSAMLNAALAFNQPVGNWNTAKVTIMRNMFYNAAAFNQNLGTWTLNASVDMYGMLQSNGMDCDHYSGTLLGWAANASTPSGRTLATANHNYGTNAVAARNTLISSKGWTITGDMAATSSCVLSSDANLSSLLLSTGTLVPVFIAGTTNYNVSYNYANSSIKLTPTTSYANALIKIRVNGGAYASLSSNTASAALQLDAGTNTIDVLVTAEDGLTTKTYTITVTRGIVTWLGNDSNDWNTASNWNTGTVPAANDKVNIPAATTHAPVTSTAQQVANLVVSNGAIFALGAPISVTGNLSINGSVTGAFAVTLNGLSSQEIEGAGSVENLEINNAGTVTITSGSSNKLNITGTLTSTDGILITNGNLVLKSSSTATARIAPVFGSISGTITQERYIPTKPARTWSLVASPFIQDIAGSWQQQVHITGMGTGGMVCPTLTAHTNGFDATITNTGSMFIYDGLKAVNTRWTQVAGTNSVNLAPGTGYRMNIRGPRTTGCSLLDGTASGLLPTEVTLSSIGSLSNASKNLGSFSITYNNNGDATSNNDNYLMVGNPYPSQINFASLLAANNGPSGINNTYATYAPGNTVGNYAFWNGSTWTGGNTGLSDATGNIIANGQGFFIQGKIAGANIALNFTESMKTASTNNGYFRTQSNPNRLRIGYMLNNGSKADEIMLQFEDKATSHELNDGDIVSINTGSQNLKSVKANRELAFNTRNSHFSADTVLLNVASSSNGTFKLSFYDFDQLVAGTNTKIYLLDKYMGTTQLMNDTKDYPFTVAIADSASYGKERFAVVFSKSMPVTIPMVAEIKAYPNPVATHLNIQLPGNGSHTIKLMDAMGKLLVQQNASSSTTINMAKLAAGTYLLETSNEKGEKTIQKIVKQ